MERIALVTGASRGIGSAVALRLAQDGFGIWLNYRSDDRAAARVAEQVEQQGVSCILMRFDVADAGQVADTLGPALSDLDPDERVLEVLVNNAGITRDGILAWMKNEDWSDVIDTNLNGVYNVTRSAMSAMISQKEGRIVNMTSISGRTGNQGQTNYSASKAGVIGFTRSLSREVARFGVTVNAVAPGFIESDMTSRMPRSEIRKLIPARRLGRPEEVASVVSFLCTAEAAYVNGAVIDVNGGLY
jgi:3-oxoacyl-[acyl-carrier protein] reductase